MINSSEAKAPQGRLRQGRPSGFHMLALGLLTTACAVALGLVFTRRLIDFPVYYSAGRSLIAGKSDLYAPDFARGALMDYRYPPFFLTALIPLWRLPYMVAAYLWYFLSLGCIAVCVYSVEDVISLARMYRVEVNDAGQGGIDRRGPVKVWIVVLLIAGPYFVMELHYGNAHLLAIALLFAGLALAIRGRDIGAAAMLALSITIKFTPILVLPYFVLKRQWTLLSLILTMLVAINLAPALYFGFGKNLQLAGTWSRHVLLEQEFHEINGPINLSLKGQLKRCLTHVDYGQRVDGDVNYPEVNVAAVGPNTVSIVWVAVNVILSVGVFGFLLFLNARAAQGRAPAGIGDGPRSNRFGLNPGLKFAPLELSLIICWMLLAEPLTSKIYFIALLWPVATLAYIAWGKENPDRPRLRKILAALAAINVMLPLLPGRALQRLLLVGGSDFYLTWVLLVLVVWLLFSFRRMLQAPTGEQQMKDPQEATGPSILPHPQN